MIPKYRAWDKHKQKMFANNELIIWNGNVYANDSKKLTCNNLKGWSIDDEYLMQSTGLKDKNGKEIFEGDLIKTSSAVCLVDFGEYTYLEDDETEITAIGFYLAFLNTHPVSCCPFESLFWKGCEVIGNIHENELDLIMYEAWKFNKVVADDSKI
jgi:uncharacterized phage protein (TIGR01671 family)